MRFILSLLMAALALPAVATPAVAATYQASPAASAPAKVIARDVMWRCGTAGCAASHDYSRASVVCSGLVKKIGRVTAFAANGNAFDAAALRACNARAK